MKTSALLNAMFRSVPPMKPSSLLKKHGADEHPAWMRILPAAGGLAGGAAGAAIGYKKSGPTAAAVNKLKRLASKATKPAAGAVAQRAGKLKLPPAAQRALKAAKASKGAERMKNLAAAAKAAGGKQKLLGALIGAGTGATLGWLPQVFREGYKAITD